MPSWRGAFGALNIIFHVVVLTIRSREIFPFRLKQATCRSCVRLSLKAICSASPERRELAMAGELRAQG